VKGSLRGTLADRKELQLSLKAKVLMRRYDVGSSVLGEANRLNGKECGCGRIVSERNRIGKVKQGDFAAR
jgi:hypothetical protein